MKFKIKFSHWVLNHRLWHTVPMLIYVLGYLLWFNIVESIPRVHYVQVTMHADRLIPFVEVFILPYLSWFGYVAFGLIWIYLHDWDAYDRLCSVLIVGMTAFLIVSTFIPNRQPLRLTQMPRENIFTNMIIGLWKMDTPTNVWPSIHVYNTSAVIIAFLDCKSKLTSKKWFRAAIVTWGVLIVLSTMLIKQHSLFDVLSALAIIAVCYGWVYIAGHSWKFRKCDDWITSHLEEFLTRVGEKCSRAEECRR